MRVILDTCVLSELRKSSETNHSCDKNVWQFINTMENEQIFISVITIGEITKGIQLLSKGNRQNELHTWLQTMENNYQQSILEIDIETVRIWGDVTATAQKNGRIVAASDGLIAATAIRHGMHVVTRNESDFKPTGVMLINPWN
ncbi:MAG TPA: VapC toxin family PIN domain ribonuclease [Gammaproteobacteria bacterium]|jgi:predicted nucleic acid-binding protein|nr:VapC toxin family PIN domain ribonuclease [Gammaproteobacteria bacterium]